MFKALNSLGILITIEEYLKTSKNKEYPVYCPNCERKVIVKAKNSLEKTHFSHKPNESCSCVTYDEYFTNTTNPKTIAEINNLRINIICHAFDIYRKITTFIPKLPYQFYIDNLLNLNKTSILSLKNIYWYHIPYIWLNSIPNYNNIIYLYMLDTSNKNKLWNQDNKKNCIIEITPSKKQKKYYISASPDSFEIDTFFYQKYIFTLLEEFNNNKILSDDEILKMLFN